MTTPNQLNSRQKELFRDLWNAIFYKKSTAHILKEYQSKYRDSANQDIRKVLAESVPGSHSVRY